MLCQLSLLRNIWNKITPIHNSFENTKERKCFEESLCHCVFFKITWKYFKGIIKQLLDFNMIGRITQILEGFVHIIFASMVMVINTLLYLCNSSFPTQPHSIILKLLLIKVPYSELRECPTCGSYKTDKFIIRR